MTERDFCYWLQGYFEILDPASEGLNIPLGARQVQCIQEHLKLVFQHKATPPAPTPTPIDWMRRLQTQAQGDQIQTGVWGGATVC